MIKRHQSDDRMVKALADSVRNGGSPRLIVTAIAEYVHQTTCAGPCVCSKAWQLRQPR